MPKVAPEYLAARRAQIVEAAARLFAAQGFAATPMSAIVAASGMSAGAVYHYFPAKRDLIAAVGERLRDAYQAPLGPLVRSNPLPPPVVVIEAIATELAAVHEGDIDFTRLGVLLWGEALRDADLAQGVSEVQRALRDSLAELVRRWQGQGDVDPAADPDAVASALYALMPGFTIQLNLLGGVSAATLATGLAALTRSPDHGVGPAASMPSPGV